MERIHDSYIAAMQGIPGVGAMTIRRLLDTFGSGKNAWEASKDKLKKSGYMTADIIDQFVTYRKTFSLDKFVNSLQSNSISYVTWEDVAYPLWLRATYNPPVVLFYRGKNILSNRMIAMVGARKATIYGKQVARHFGESLSNYGVTIVSGGARGIDTCSHEGALEGSSPTVAVMGCGLDIVYPRENKKLYEKIEEKGMIVSEYVPGTPPVGSNFPARNRIISGLCRGVIVVEARASSGSLITADMALSEGRDVFAIPGNIYANTSAGVHWLIQQGAMMAFSPEDILGEYGWLEERISSQGAKSVVSFTIEENKVMQYLSTERGMAIDVLIEKTGFSFGQVHMALMKLEMNKYVSHLSTGEFILLPRR